MNKVVKKKKNTLFGRIVRKIESERASQKEKAISVDTFHSDSCSNVADAVTINSRRDELKSAKHDNSDVIIFFNGEK